MIQKTEKEYYIITKEILYMSVFLRLINLKGLKIIFEKGDYYIGQCKNNLRKRKYIKYYKNGSIKYEGEYINSD